MKKVLLTLLLMSAILAGKTQGTSKDTIQSPTDSLKNRAKKNTEYGKGLYLTLGGGIGSNSFRYTLDNDNKSIPGLGYGGNIGIQYFFTKHIGIATGIGLSYYSSKANYSNSLHENTDGSYSYKYAGDKLHYLFPNMYDNDPFYGGEWKDYNLYLGLDNWTETQKAYFLEIPLMLMYHAKWGASQSWGMYAGIGVKVQIPAFKEQYEVKNGSELTVVGEYIKNGEGSLWLPQYGAPDISQHGYGANDRTGFSGDLKLKTGIAAAAKLGLIKTLSKRVDLTLGAYFDYGLTDIKSGNTASGDYLINPANANTIHTPAPTKVGDNLQYNGYINSYAVDKAKLLGVGGEIGLRIKLGKLPQEPKKDTVIPEIKPEKLPYKVWVLDSLTKQPITVQAAMACQDCPKPDNQSFFSLEQDAVTVELYPENNYGSSFTKLGFPTYNTKVTTTPNQKEITILVPLHPQLIGIIKNAHGKSLPDAKIQITTPNGKNYDLVTDPNGQFFIPSIDAGIPYTIVASKAGYTPDTILLSVPSDPAKLQPIYNVDGMQLRPIKKMVLSALVLFDLDKFDLRPEAKGEINRIIPMLLENPQITIEVGGHTDSRGSAKHNQKLSQNRASSVRDYLVEQGIAPNRVTAKGYGFTQLVNKCKPGVKCTDGEHQENRRVEFIFSETTIIKK